jgi:hypothetical protein
MVGVADSSDGDFVSLCCGAQVRVAGDLTQHYVCVECLKPCDWTTRAQDKAWREMVALGQEIQGET